MISLITTSLTLTFETYGCHFSVTVVFFFRMCILKDIYHILLIILTMTMLYAVVPLRYTSVPMSEHIQYQTIFVFMFLFFFLPVLLVVQSVIKISK